MTDWSADRLEICRFTTPKRYIVLRYHEVLIYQKNILVCEFFGQVLQNTQAVHRNLDPHNSTEI